MLYQSVSRRTFMKAGAAGAASWSSARQQAACQTPTALAESDDRSVVLICNLGGPSQLDTWDPKPHAELDVRGPFRAIRTRVPGIWLSELFPRHAAIAQHLAFVRTCQNPAPALHHTGWQCMLTQHEFFGGLETPAMGARIAHIMGPRNGLPPYVVLPALMRVAPKREPTGQMAGMLGPAHDPILLEAVTHPGAPRPSATQYNPALAMAVDVSREMESTRQRYGHHRIGRNCLAARRLVEAGVRFVIVNAFVDLYSEPTWDLHGRSPFAGVAGTRCIAPMYDQGVSALIQDLAVRGLLDSTMVCCLAEFGRTPRINQDGGRDHWPNCFTTYFAGGGVQGGQTIGQSDATASEPIDRPVQPAEIVASIMHSLRVPLPSMSGDLATENVAAVPCPQPPALQSEQANKVEPIAELFGGLDCGPLAQRWSVRKTKTRVAGQNDTKR